MLPIQLDLGEKFFEEEIRDGFLVTRERKEIWAVELDLLVQFDRVCKKNNLVYFLDGGTLLGAIRHKGFIPWDDDIDIEMFREDYDKLLRIADKEFAHPYFFQSAYSDEGYIRGHSQLRNSNTCGALPNEAYKVNFNQGIFLDIFVLDGIPGDQKQLEEQVEELQRCSRTMGKIVYPRKDCMVKYIFKLLRRWIYIKSGKIKALYRNFEDCARRYINSEDIFLLTFYKKTEAIKRFPREWYSKVIYVPFESLQCPIPSGYKEILTAYYGEDFMIPKNVPSTHGELIFDTKRSYRDVLKKCIK